MPFLILKYWYQDMYPAMSFSDIAIDSSLLHYVNYINLNFDT